MRVTLDSGILVRGSTSPMGPAARLIRELVPPIDRIVLSEFILGEFQRVLAYPRIRPRFDADEIAIRGARFRAAAELVIPAAGPPVVRADPNDDPVVYTAVAGKADVLCTLDRRFYEPGVAAFLREHGIRVLSDVELLRELLLGRVKGHSV